MKDEMIFHCCREIPETSYTPEQVTYSTPDAEGIPNNSREMRSRGIRVQNSHTTARKMEQWAYTRVHIQQLVLQYGEPDLIPDFRLGFNN